MESHHRNSLVYAYVRHPLATQAIEKILARVRPTLKFIPKPTLKAVISEQVDSGILILDTCSVPEWPEIASKWRAQKGHTLVLVPEPWGQKVAVRALSLGVCGIVPMSRHLERELPQALESIRDQRPWIKEDVLNEYVRMTSGNHRQSLSPCGRFTVREEQILDLLLKGFSNRKIAEILGISERTAKYHVSNILEKSQVRNRKELLLTNRDSLLEEFKQTERDAACALPDLAA